MIKVLGEHGGAAGVNFGYYFLGEGEVSRIQDIAKHIRHLSDVGGMDCVALGTDFYGIPDNLEIKNAAEMGLLANYLKKEGFKESHIDKIFYGNTERIIREVLR